MYHTYIPGCWAVLVHEHIYTGIYNSQRRQCSLLCELLWLLKAFLARLSPPPRVTTLAGPSASAPYGPECLIRDREYLLNRRALILLRNTWTCRPPYHRQWFVFFWKRWNKMIWYTQILGKYRRYLPLCKWAVRFSNSIKSSDVFFKGCQVTQRECWRSLCARSIPWSGDSPRYMEISQKKTTFWTISPLCLFPM